MRVDADTKGVCSRRRPGTESSLTLSWREMDSNFQYASTVRWHRATDLPLPPTVKRRSAGRPPPMARPRSKAQRGSVKPAAMRSTHREMRCSAAVQAARYRAARRAAMRSAHCEIRQGENVTLQYLSHDGRPAPRRASRRHCAARRHRTFANGKIPAARPGRHSVEFHLVREDHPRIAGDLGHADLVIADRILAARKSRAEPKVC